MEIVPCFARLALMGCLFMSPTSLEAQETIVGVWKVISVETKEIGSDNVAKPFGEHLNATFIFTVGGNMAAVITAEDRRPPPVQTRPTRRGLNSIARFQPIRARTVF